MPPPFKSAPSGSSAAPDTAEEDVVIVWETDLDGRVRQVNASWSDFTGQPFEAYEQLGWLDAIHEEDRARVQAAWQSSVELGHPMRAEYRLRRHDGVYRFMSSRGLRRAAASGAGEWVGLCLDVTAQREQQAETRRAQQRLELLDRIGLATRVLTDPVEVMAVTTRLLAEHLGATRCAYADMDSDGDGFTIRSDWSVAGVPSSVGHYSLAAFGSLAEARLRAGDHLVVHDVDGELADDDGARTFRSIGIKAIICASLVKGERLVALMAVHQAQPRTWSGDDVAVVAEVVERCWVHIERVRSEALVREQDRHKDEFLATLAHELRNPLAPMKYALVNLRRTADPARVKHAQDVLDRQTTQLARLVDDLLDVSRVSRGLIRLQFEPASLMALLADAADAARPTIEAAGHRFEVELPVADADVSVDVVRFAQMVGNLLVNAAKYTPSGGHVTLAAAVTAHGVIVEVRDDGVGVPLDQQDRLFTLFTQLQHTAALAKGGLGIGLSLVQRLAQLHGGRAGMRSAGPGLGSCFWIELPLAQGGSPAVMLNPGSAPVPVAREPRGAPDASSDPLRILVVEDNHDGRETLVELLQAAGHTIAQAADGEAALTVAATFRPDVALVDIGLPRLDGLGVARWFRAQPEQQRTRLIALTGWGSESDRRRTADAGFDAHLNKPVDVPVLLHTVGQVTGRSR